MICQVIHMLFCIYGGRRGRTLWSRSRSVTYRVHLTQRVTRRDASCLVMEHDDREDLPRISVDSIQEWRRIKSNYLSAAIAQLDEQLEASGRIAERETFLAHLTEVRTIPVDSCVH